MIMARRCRSEVSRTELEQAQSKYGDFQCARDASTEVEGIPYCAQHANVLRRILRQGRRPTDHVALVEELTARLPARPAPKIRPDLRPPSRRVRVFHDQLEVKRP
jgi:hypothetical protein